MCQDDKNATPVANSEQTTEAKELPKDDGRQMSQSEIDALIAMLLG